MTALAVGYLIFKYSGAGIGRNEKSQSCGSKCQFYFARLHHLSSVTCILLLVSGIFPDATLATFFTKLRQGLDLVRGDNDMNTAVNQAGLQIRCRKPSALPLNSCFQGTG
jgi:hypothetical protein